MGRNESKSRWTNCLLSRLKYIIDEEANLIGAKFYARENGRKEGKALGVLQTAQNMINKGLSDELITELTNLPLESVQELRKNNKSESSTGLWENWRNHFYWI